jgi:hypothetical protein
MSKKTCPLETDVLKSLREEKMSQELQDHIDECPVCRDIALVQGWMHRFKENAWENDMTEKSLPEAKGLWNLVHARRMPDKKLVKKALRPLLIPQALFYGLFVAGIIWVSIWGFKKFGGILDNPIIAQLAPFFGIMMVIVLISLSFCAIVVAFDRRKHPIS